MKGKTATFNGKHNESKSLMLLAMYKRKKRGLTSGLGLTDLAAIAGISYKYLKARATRLTKWDYIRREKIKGCLYKCRYYLTARGKRFVEQTIPKNKYIEYSIKLDDHWDNLNNNPKYWKLLNG